MTDHAEVLRRVAAYYRQAQKHADDRADELASAVRAAYHDPDQPMRKAEILRATGHVWSRTWLDEVLKKAGPPPGDSDKPEHPPVVAAIVTSELGVLISRRNDGVPPWGFIAGKVEPGESIADAVVREVKEETGLRIYPAPKEIGRRVHPKTGKTMIYLACTLAAGLDAHVGDTDELAEVKWASLREAERLLPGMFEPVHAFLRREIGDVA